MSVLLYWLPLGADDPTHCVRWNGRIFEWAAARRQSRPPCELYHSALEVDVDGVRHTIEMAPVWQSNAHDRGVICEGAVGAPALARFRLFRYEVRCWRDGVIPDVACAVDSPQLASTDDYVARRILERVQSFPNYTWGRDEQRTGDMWNSNSLVAWLLACAHADFERVELPVGGRAPGWDAGLTVARRDPARRTSAL